MKILTKQDKKKAKQFRYNKIMEIVNKKEKLTEEEIWIVLSLLRMYGKEVF